MFASLLEYIRLFRGWDFVDIALVSFIVYRLLLIIKGTRAGQILVGLALLFGVYWMSDWLQMRTLRFTLSNIFDNLFLIFIVLFQNDIRRALSQVGKTSWFSARDALQQSQIIEELVKSCVSLSNKKIGALIVIERQANVEDFIEPGTPLDSQLSKEVLTSIFLPVSPLHDGAVILRKGRIHMAGCFLPLTLNPNISKALGTRHRAAVGLTEETDALCLVVSEENASISVAMSGKIQHQLDAAELRKLLLENL